MNQQKYILTIEEPCQEKWSSMQTITAGRFCGNCAKSVIDFTHLSDNQIIKMLEKANDSKLCGRFDNRQLNRIIIQTNAEKSNPILFKLITGLLLVASIESTGQAIEKLKVESFIRGKVTHTSQIGLEGAEVKTNSKSVKTDALGNFEITAKIGDSLKVSKPGFLETAIKVNTANEWITLRQHYENYNDSRIILGGITAHKVVKEPLFIVDGIPVDEDAFASIKPADVKSINVLKDAAATSIYGNRGENGVIVVTTLSGSEKRKSKKNKNN